MIEKVAKASENIANENLDTLRKVFPQFVKDGEIDFDALKAFFDTEGILAGTEKYGLNWAGKSNAFQAIRTPATGTLTPQPEESKNFEATENVFIEGDNLEVLKLLQKHYREKIKMIYIDPPYNTGKDFVYKDNFTKSVADYYEQTGQTEGGIKMTANTEKNGRYHSDWLTMMYPRLFLAKNLLREDGVIFVSIDDNEVANLRLIMDEIFGEENFVAEFIWIRKKKGAFLSKKVRKMTEYILCYQKAENDIKLFGEEAYSDKQQPIVKRTNSLKVLVYPTNSIKTKLGDGVYSEVGSDEQTGVSFLNSFEVKGGVIITELKTEARYVWTQDFLNDEIRKGTEIFLSTKFGFNVLRHDQDEKTKTPSTLISKENNVGTNEDASWEIAELFEAEIGSMFDYAKPSSLIKYLINAITFEDKDGIILDFFAGSGTTAHAVMDLNAEDGGNRKWICVQLPEVTDEENGAYKAGYKTIAEISRERIRRAGEKIGKVDSGFKSYKLSPSNYRQWNEVTSEDDKEKLLQQAKLFADKPLSDGYDEQSVVYEILVKEGFDLNTNVTQEKSGLNQWIITDGDKKLVVTFADKVTKDQVEKLNLSPGDTLACFDSALDDTTKVNISRNVNLKVI